MAYNFSKVFLPARRSERLGLRCATPDHMEPEITIKWGDESEEGDKQSLLSEFNIIDLLREKPYYKI